MKKILLFSLLASSMFARVNSFAQEDKSKRPSPPAVATATTAKGNKITIDYSQPAVKGRTIGKEIAPFDKVWRTGANEATSFEITKNAKIEGKYPLPAGKYGLYSIPGEKSWTIIFNKKWQQSGLDYNQADDVIRVAVKPVKATDFTERMTFKISKNGLVSLVWGHTAVNFTVN